MSSSSPITLTQNSTLPPPAGALQRMKMKSSNFLDNLLNRFPILLQGARFVAIGAINTSLDFLILNGIAKALGINTGGSLGLVNLLSAGLAIVQSYFWNHSWAFSARRAATSVAVEFIE